MADASRTCETCPTPLRPGAHAATRFCPACVAGREAARQASRTRSLQQRARRAAATARGERPGDVSTGSPTFRQRADPALNRGRCQRRCPECGRLYVPATLEAPCPGCSNHLQDVPQAVRFG